MTFSNRSQVPQPVRRSLLKKGLIGGALLAIVGGGVAVWQFGQNASTSPHTMGSRKPSLAQVNILTASSRAILPHLTATQISELVNHCDTAIAGLSETTQEELGLLFKLLGSDIGRRLSGMPSEWTSATAEQSAAWLQGLRFHRLSLLQTAYHAIHDIVLGSHYGNPSHWAGFGYPGPPDLSHLG